MYIQPGPTLSLVAVKPLGKIIILVLVFGCFGPVFGQSLPQDPIKRVWLDKWCRTRIKLAPQTNYIAISWLIPGQSQKLKCKMAA